MASYYKFFNALNLRKFLSSVFDLTTGHDHDGVNSKAVTTGTPADSAVTTAKIAANALAASAAGRGKIQTGFFDAATVADKFAADSCTNAVLLQIIQDGAFAASTATRALFADALFTPAKLSTVAKTHVITYAIEDLAAGGDISTRVLFVAPTGVDVTITSASIIPIGTAAGIDDSNTCVVALSDGTNDIVSATYNTSNALPAAGSVGDLGTPHVTYKVLSAGEKLCLSVTNGATANPPAIILQVTYTVADAA
jgi:hypothetical protein